MSIVKIETASSVTLVLNGNTVFASDDTSYWLQGAKVIGDDGHVYGHAETIRDALCLVLAKYGGLSQQPRLNRFAGYRRGLRGNS